MKIRNKVLVKRRISKRKTCLLEQTSCKIIHFKLSLYRRHGSKQTNEAAPMSCRQLATRNQRQAVACLSNE